jgi:hypothetical protein
VVLPEPHPEPLSDLNAQPLPTYMANGPWVRSHATLHSPLHFGRAGLNRFDAPGGQYGILYLAADIHGAFIETFGRALGVRTITVARLASRLFTEVRQTRPLRVVDLTGPGLARIGADGRLSTGAYDLSQRWALALHEHPDRPDGLLYRSRHDPNASAWRSSTELRMR